MAHHGKGPNSLFYLYTTVIGLAGLVLVYRAWPYVVAVSPIDIIVFCLITILCEANPLPLPNEKGTVSVGFALIYASLILYGPEAAIWIAAFGTIRWKEITGRVSLEKVIFNRGQLAVSAAAAGLIFVSAGGMPGQLLEPVNYLPLALAGLVYFVVNFALMSVAIALMQNLSIRGAWALNLKWITSVNYLVLIPLGVLIAVVYLLVGPAGVILFFLPLLIARHSLQQYVDTRRLLLGTINALVSAVEARDPYTSGHSERVKGYVVATARAMKLPEDLIQSLEYVASLHDIGKIGVRDAVLRKDGPLDPEEWEEIRQHPVIGAAMLEPIEILDKEVALMRHHHERWDGSGYPDRLAGEEIPIGSRIIAVCDAYDAMTSSRPYRPTRTHQEALEELRRCAGTQCDPAVVEAFASAVRETAKV